MKYKVHILSVLFFIGNLLPVIAQQNFPVKVNTTINPPYSPYFEDYFSPLSNKWESTILFNDFSEPEWEVKLKFSIESNKVRIQTRQDFIPSQPIRIFPGVPTTISGADLSPYFQYQNLNLAGVTAQSISQNGRLPEGFYNFCIEVLDYKTGTPLSLKSCYSFWIQLNDEPISITPVCGSVVKPNPTQNIAFQWHQSNAVSPNSLGTEYNLTLYEITDFTINPLNAIQNNKVLKIFESGFLNQNTYIYDMTAPVLDVGKKYIYTIQARDIEGKDVFKNKGVSQPCWFWYGYQVNGNISIQQPLNGAGFSLSDPLYFKWSSPDKLLNNQSFNYYLKIVKFDTTQVPEDAMISNPVWYEETTNITNRRYPYDILLKRKLDPQANYAWQVTAYSEGQVIASSPVYTFKGPGVIEEFRAGMQTVKVKTTFNQNLNDLSGVATVTLSEDGKTQDVSFSHLRIIDVAGRYVLDNGSIEADLEDTTLIALNPAKSENKEAYFHPKRFRLNKESLDLYGNVTWEIPHPVTSFKKAYATSVFTWINYDIMKLRGNAVLNSKNQFILLDPYEFNINLHTSSDFLIGENTYYLRFDGDVVFTEAIKGTDITAGKVKIPFSQAAQLFYIINNDVNLSNNIMALANSNLVIAPASYIIDLSETQSPPKLSENLFWKGVYFPKYKIQYNSDADKFGQLVFTKPLEQLVEQTPSDNNINWIDATGLNFFLFKKFASSDLTTFNKFPSLLNTLKIEVQKNTIKNSVLSGSIIIPFISTSKRHPFTCPISNNGFEPGYLDSLDASAFTFNKGAGEQEVNITITRAVFADRERLDLTLDLDWPYLNVSQKSLTGFKAWGNYNIGFVFPNGSMLLTNQISGSISSYPVTFDGIGAGNSNGAYAFALTGKAVIAEDISGESGPPVVNVYSTAPNSLLPQTPYVAPSEPDKVASIISIPQTQNSYEDNINIIANDFRKQLYQSSTRVTSVDATDENLTEVLTTPTTSQVSIEEVIDKPRTQRKDTSWASINFSINQKALVDEIYAAVSIAMAQPLTQGITASVDSQVVKVTHRVDKFRDSLSAKVGRYINRMVDSLALKVIAKLKKPDFDPTDQVTGIASKVSENLSKEIKGNISKSVDNNITRPFRSFFNTEISVRANNYIEIQIRKMVLDAGEGKLNFNGIVGNLIDGLPILLHGVGNDAFGMISMSNMERTMGKIGKDAIGGIRIKDIDKLLLRAIDAEASYIVSKALSNKASEAVNNLANKLINDEGNVSASAGIGVKMNFANLGRNLKEGRVDKIVKLDAVSVALNTKFVSFGGLLHYTPSDPTYGNIWKGGVSLNVKLPKKFMLEGIYVSGRKEETSYWFCQISGVDADKNGKVKLGEPMDRSAKALSSAVNLGPVELVGASGRLYYHMKDEPGKPIVPDANTNYGAGVNFVFFDASSHGMAFRLAVGANVEIKGDGNYVIDFEGDMQAGNKNPQVRTPDPTMMGGGGIKLNYNSAEQHFLGKGWMVIKNDAVCAKGNIAVDVKPGFWSVQVGHREDMIMVTPGCNGWGAVGWVGVNTTTANAGLGLSYSLYHRIGLDVGPVGGGINIDAGLAAGIQAVIQYRPKINLMEAGIFVQAWANIGIDWHTAVKSGYINLVGINLQGDLLMTFAPPPTKLKGLLRGHVEVLCFGVDFDAGFEKTL